MPPTRTTTPLLLPLAAAALLLSAALPVTAAPPPRIANFCDGEPIPPERELCCSQLAVADSEQVTVDTPLGRLVIELYSNVAPETVANFRGYIDRGDYTDTLVHRVVPANPPSQPEDFVIQTGGYRLSGIVFESIERQDPVVNEPCLSNVEATVAMARLGGQVNSATSEWFVNLSDDNVALDTVDEGFTVFGRVVANLPVASEIVALPDTLPPTPAAAFQVVIQNSVLFVLDASPMLSEVVFDPGPHGCFDVAQAGALLIVDPLVSNSLIQNVEPDTVNGLPFYLVSTACEGFGAGSPLPPIECDESGRRVVLIDADTGAALLDPLAELGYAEATLSCDAIAASDEGLAMRRSVTSGQIADAMVETAYTIPEPSLPLAATTSLLTLIGLARARKSHGR